MTRSQCPEHGVLTSHVWVPGEIGSIEALPEDIAGLLPSFPTEAGPSLRRSAHRSAIAGPTPFLRNKPLMPPWGRLPLRRESDLTRSTRPAKPYPARPPPATRASLHPGYVRAYPEAARGWPTGPEGDRYRARLSVSLPPRSRPCRSLAPPSGGKETEDSFCLNVRTLLMTAVPCSSAVAKVSVR